MRELTTNVDVDEAVATTFTSAGWIMAAARQRELERLSQPLSRPAGWSEARGAKLRREAEQVRHDMGSRLLQQIKG
ncbi:hypothetical protein [Planotetraspora mira]|uniref:hypothetical protein n=1 Tax=Planotetraspora mira TaxID=58121 RepID=UPI0036701C9C